jgi:hypothetical protein
MVTFPHSKYEVFINHAVSQVKGLLQLRFDGKQNGVVCLGHKNETSLDM